jgi:hypothetical protein
VGCLYLSDFGPPEPSFDPLTNDGALIRGFEEHAGQLKSAHNLAQLEAMERAFRRGDEITWCNPSYGWAESGAVHALFAAIAVFIVLPYLGWRLGAPWWARRDFQAAPPALLCPSSPTRK